MIVYGTLRGAGANRYAAEQMQFDPRSPRHLPSARISFSAYTPGGPAIRTDTTEITLFRCLRS